MLNACKLNAKRSDTWRLDISLKIEDIDWNLILQVLGYSSNVMWPLSASCHWSPQREGYRERKKSETNVTLLYKAWANSVCQHWQICYAENNTAIEVAGGHKLHDLSLKLCWFVSQREQRFRSLLICYAAIGITGRQRVRSLMICMQRLKSLVGSDWDRWWYAMQQLKSLVGSDWDRWRDAMRRLEALVGSG